MRKEHLSLLVAAGFLITGGCEGGTGPDDTPSQPENVVGPGGGTVTVENLTLEVPAGALSAEVEITAEPITPASGAVSGDYLVVEGTAFDLGPDGLAFEQPAELTIGYDGAEVPPGILDSELGILQRNGGVSHLLSIVNASAGTVRASLDHFSDVVVGMSEGDYERVACPDLSVAASSGLPLERIALGRLPSTFEPPLLARVEDRATGADEEPVHSYTLVALDGTSGEAELVVPIHPSASPDGGEARVLVTDGTVACAPFDFTVEAMQPAPGELGAIAGHVQSILREQAAVLGTTPEELVATPSDDLPPALRPLALAQTTLDHPDNDRSLAAIAAGASPDAAETRLDLVEPLLARTGLRQELAVAGAEARRRLATSRVAPDNASINPDFCTPTQVGSDAGKLNDCMNLAWHEAFRRDGASGEVLDNLGAAFGVAGMVPGLGTPATIAGFVAWFMANQTKRNAALLPSVLTGFSIEASHEEFLEDEEATGFWSNARLTASNLSWDMGKEALEGLLQVAQLAGIVDKVDISPTQISDVMSYILTNPVANEFLEGGTIEEFQTKPEKFGPVDASSDDYSESRIATGDAVELTSHQEYEPRNWGTATLSVRTEDGEFGGQQRSDQVEITVKRLQIDISPGEVHLKSGEPQDFNVTVTDSKHPELVEVDESVPLQGSVEEIAYIGDGLHIVSYTAPPDPDFDPDLLTVRHTAESGARGHSTDERNAIATIRFAEITISPRAVCVEPGSVVQFKADVKGLEDKEVTWEADVGTIDANGLYTAPSSRPTGGTATVTARSVSTPSVTDEVTIQIGGCSVCRFDVTLSGGVGGVGQGPASFYFDGSLLVLGLIRDLVPDLSGDHIQGQFEVPWTGDPGTFPVTYGDVVNRTTDPDGLAQYDPGWPTSDCESCGGSVTIDTATPTMIEGVFEVTMSTLTPDPNLPPTTATGTFRAALGTPDASDVDAFSICLKEWR